jgi:alpha/beta superfamily hydrolase
MQLPSMLQGEHRVRLIQGAVTGSVLTMIVGFGFGGWQLQTNVERRAEVAVNKAVVAVLTPICVDKFRQAADVKATTVALNATDSWHRDTFVEKGGWATFPGSKEPNARVAEACAQILSEAK